MSSEGLGKGSCFTVEVPMLSPLSNGNNISKRGRFSVENHLPECNKSTLLSWGFTTGLKSFLESSFLAQNWGAVTGRNRVADITTIDPFNKKPLSDIDREQIHPTFTATAAEGCSDDMAYRDLNDKVSSSKRVDISFTNSRKSRILIVDDVPMNRKMLKRLVIDRFDECMEAENGQQAVDMVKDAIESGVHYDIITMDYQMPVMDGVTATSIIRKIGFAGRIVGITGNAMLEDLNSFISSGADIVLTKPLSIAKLNEYLTTLS